MALNEWRNTECRLDAILTYGCQRFSGKAFYALFYANGVNVSGGTIIYATLIGVSLSTKNKDTLKGSPVGKETNMPDLIQTRWGYYQFAELPTDEELQRYYRDKYYQEGCGSYEVDYSEEELRWRDLVADLHLRMAERLNSANPKRVLDVGCGEGFLMEAFSRAGHDVYGIDFSQKGLARMHPHLLPRLKQGNVFTILEELVAGGVAYDIVSLMNIVEHVKDPVGLLCDLKSLLGPGSLLIIKVPNDFSPLHDLLRCMGKQDRWWVGYPDHLSYFNKESMECLLDDLGYSVLAVLADNPIDLNLLNDESDYIADKSKGKSVHRFRIRTDNFLGSINREKMLDAYAVFGSMGIGRCLTYFVGLGGK